MQSNNRWFRRAVTGVIAGTTALGGLAGLAATAAHATPAVTTTPLYGADRYASAGISNGKAFPGGVGEVVLADGLPGHQGDALAASGYAGVNGYGVLLTDNTNTVPANTLTALANLKVKTIQPVGGTAAISPSQLAQLAAAGYTVKPSLAGATSLDTMQAINDTIPPSSVGTSGTGSSGTGTLKTAILASVDENHLIDALSAAGLSYANKFPLITTESTSSTLSSQAQQVITTLGIQKLIVVGGTASIPSSQYTPMPSGVTSLDTVTTGADRAATSYLLATDEVANYGMGKTQMDLAAGATFVGNTQAVQNDGADALSSAPFAGTNKFPTLVTDGPTQLQTTQGPVTFATNEASTLTNINLMTGPANLPQSQVSQVVTAAGGSSAPASNTYTVTPGPSATPLTPTASTASAPSQGVESYTVSGLPTSGSTVNIALFPCTGNAQTGNGAVNGAPGNSSTGATTFTAPGGTSPQAGNAVGQGTTSANGTPATTGYSNGSNNASNGATNPLTGSPYPGYSSTAYIASVNGVPTADDAANGGPTQVYGVSAPNGTLTFVLNSFSTDCAIPVVYTAPASAGSTPALLVNANGTPQTGYSVGEGQATYWQAPPAPSSNTGYTVEVISANPSANTFAGAVLTGPSAGQVYTFNYGTTGSGYFYTDGTPLSEAAFGSYLSGPVTSDIPNTTTPQAVNGDEVAVGPYAAGAPSSFQYSTAAVAPLPVGFGDVPNAPTNVAATYNGAAYTTGGVSQPGVVVTWTPPINPDVSGTQAVSPSATVPASYSIYREPVTSAGAATTTNTAPQLAGTVTVSSASSGNTNLNGGTTSETSPEFIDTGATTGQSYLYYVVAKASNVGGSQSSPYSAPSSSVAAGSGASTPVIKSVQIVPSTVSCTNSGTPSVPVGCAATGTYSGTAGYAIVTYSANVTCATAAGPDFSYSNTGGAPTNVKGSTCYTSGGSAGAGGATPVPNTGGANTALAGNQLEVDFAPIYQSGTNSTGGPVYSAENIAAPGTGDTFTYTAPSTQTTSNSVYVTGTVSNPVYAASQTVSDNGNPSATTNSGTATSPSNPLY